MMRIKREELNMSVADLARKSGVNKSTIWRLEEFGRDQKFTIVCDLAEALGISIEEIRDNING